MTWDDFCAAPNLPPLLPSQATQLYEMVLVRHGLMLVGMPFSGKTAAYTVRACVSIGIWHLARCDVTASPFESWMGYRLHPATGMRA